MKKKKLALLAIFLLFLFFVLISVSFSQTGLFFFYGTPTEPVKTNFGAWKLFGEINISNGTVTIINPQIG